MGIRLNDGASKIKININGLEDDATIEVTEHDVTLQFETVEKADNIIVISKGDFGLGADSIKEYFEDVFKGSPIKIERNGKNQPIIVETAEEEDGTYEYKHAVTTRMIKRKKIEKE